MPTSINGDALYPVLKIVLYTLENNSRQEASGPPD